jgi:hypothetical protein
MALPAAGMLRLERWSAIAIANAMVASVMQMPRGQQWRRRGGKDSEALWCITIHPVLLLEESLGHCSYRGASCEARCYGWL